jgi:phospholipid transport system substrate-binding protein
MASHKWSAMQTRIPPPLWHPLCASLKGNNLTKDKKEKEGIMGNPTKGFRSSTLWKISGALVLLWPWHAWALESPSELVRHTTEQATAVLHDPSLKDHQHERREKFWQIVLPRFDTREIAKRCLGPQWNQLAEEQKEEFIQLFIELVKGSYQSTLERHAADARFSLEGEHVEGGFAEVNMQILAPSQEKPLSVNYRLHRQGEKWLIYDVVAENVSMVRNYRSQFARILKESSYEGLIQTLKKKIQDQRAGSPLTSKAGQVKRDGT